MNDWWVWCILFALGCYHGINPAMGWLFAVALGLQERSTRAVLSAIVPIALGHVISMALVVTVAVLAAQAFPQRTVRIAAGALLVGFGLYRLVRARHPRWVGMRVGFGGLVFWGFLMSSAHGAGLMVLPFVLMSHRVAPQDAMSMPMPVPGATASNPPWQVVLMLTVHTAGYLLVMALTALLVYQRFGLRILRTAWFNVDLVWAAALVVTGIVALII